MHKFEVKIGSDSLQNRESWQVCSVFSREGHITHSKSLYISSYIYIVITEAAGFTETTMSCSGVVFKDCSPTFCIGRQGIININKTSSVFSFRRKNKFTKMAEHFEYNHIPAHLSSIQNFHVKSVLCYQENTVVLHLVRNMITQFGIIDIGANKFLGIFGEKTAEYVNEAVRGAISPDGEVCLIKIPKPITGDAVSAFQLYDLKSRQKLREVSLHYHHALFAFDPRFGYSRIAATSFVAREDNSLSLVYTDTWDVICTNTRVDDMRRTLFPTLKDLFYSRDGHLLFTIMVSNGCHCRDRKLRRQQPTEVNIYVFHSDTAQTLHCIQYNRYICGIHSCPTNYLPIFSNCGSRMAIVLNDSETPMDHLQIYKLPTAGSLQNRTRIRILQTFTPEDVTKLQLPTRLVQFLHFQPQLA